MLAERKAHANASVDPISASSASTSGYCAYPTNRMRGGADGTCPGRLGRWVTRGAHWPPAATRAVFPRTPPSSRRDPPHAHHGNACLRLHLTHPIDSPSPALGHPKLGQEVVAHRRAAVDQGFPHSNAVPERGVGPGDAGRGGRPGRGGCARVVMCCQCARSRADGSGSPPTACRDRSRSRPAERGPSSSGSGGWHARRRRPPGSGGGVHAALTPLGNGAVLDGQEPDVQ